MNLGDSVDGASRSEHDDYGRSGSFAGPDHDKPARSPRTQETLQGIQDIIDRLAAATRQLGDPGRRVPGTWVRPELPDPVTLACESPQQAHAVGGAERGRAQQRERANVAGDVRLALQVDAAG